MTREEYVKSLEGLSDETTRNSLIAIFDENEKNKSLKNEAFSERDRIKAEKKALEDAKAAADAKAQEEQGKYKDLYEAEKIKVKDLEEFKPYKEKYDKVEADRRTELIDQLDDDELKAVAKEIPTLEGLKKFVDASLKAAGKKTVDNGRGGKGKINTQGKKWDDFSFAERQQLMKENRAEYDRLYNEKYKR